MRHGEAVLTNLTGVLTGRESACRDTEERPREDAGSRRPPSASASQGETPLRSNQPHGHFDLRLPAPRIARKYILVVKATQSVMLQSGSPSKLIHPAEGELK